MKRVAVLISGRGSNLHALMGARQDAYQIALVVSNNPDAEGLSRARDAGVAAVALDHRHTARIVKRSNATSTRC